jgi:hypothetical protein
MDAINAMSASKPNKPDKYRVVSFQSKEVVDTIFINKVYYADKDKMREGSLRQEDIDVCNGRIPIWVFQHPCFVSTDIGHGQWCVLLENFRCEMSIDSLDGLYMIELLLDKQPPMGKAHNGTSISCIIDSIKFDDVAAVYKLKETEHWYFYEVETRCAFKEDVLFKDSIKFTKELYKKDKSPRVRLIDYESADDYYVIKK